MQRRSLPLVCLLCLPLTLTACLIGPQYQRPTAPVPAAYKELPPAYFKELEGWKVAQPQDDISRGQWWTIFQDPQLNALQEQVDVSNQTLAVAEAQLRGARAAVSVARAALFPIVTAGASVSGARQSLNRPGVSNPSNATRADYQLPVDASYEIDVWGRIRRNIEANIANAQATAADLETARLSIHAELAVDYFTLHGLDAQKQLLELAVSAFDQALQITVNRYNQGVASLAEVLQARTQVETTRAQAIEVGVQRAQFEHAIAILLGKPPAEFSIPPAPIGIQPPAIPVGLPSELLERRPDIASAERDVAAANEQIGIAQAAFYPTITLTSVVGLESSSLSNLFSWPSAFWSFGSSLVQTVFDAGRRKAITEQAQAAYDATVATYRQTVLTAFQSVEDNLSTLRILEQEAEQQEKAVQAALGALNLAINRYRGGITTFLEVVIAQNAALNAEQVALAISTRRMTASVQLVRALGGGWGAAPMTTAIPTSSAAAAPGAGR
jgi:NodT family efflux transporter outer membrane factor (OMF) lipoprotein